MNVILIPVKNNVLEKKIHYLTSDYKTRNERVHNGIDMIGKNRNIDNIIAIDDGEVITSKYSTTAGYYVEIRHQNNYISRYLHMKKNSLQVNKGDRVVKGQLLGTMGNTGDSRGAHLHFAVYDTNRIPQDPLPYLLGNLNFNTDSFKNFISEVQRSLGVKVDGIPGPDTLAKTITVSATTNRKHSIVKVLQEYLYNIGYTEIGNADGIAGSKFTNAIKHFQKDNGCVVDGILNKKNKSWQKLLKLK